MPRVWCATGRAIHSAGMEVRMNLKETARMRRLETENQHLRETLERQMAIYRDQLYEIVVLKTKLDLVEEAMRYEE